MVAPSYSDIRDRIGRQLDDLTSADAKAALIEHLVELTFEVDRLKQYQNTLLAALRARDIIVHDGERTGVVTPAGLIDLDPRDALDAADGFHDIEWQKEVAFRWTGPGRDSLARIWIDRTLSVVLEITLLSYGDARNRGALVLTVDGVPVGLREVGDLVLRSDPFPCIAGSLVTEVGIHVPWLTGAGVTDGAAAEPPRGRPHASRGRSSPSRVSARDQRSRGIAIAHMRFLAPT